MGSGSLGKLCRRVVAVQQKKSGCDLCSDGLKSRGITVDHTEKAVLFRPIIISIGVVANVPMNHSAGL